MKAIIILIVTAFLSSCRFVQKLSGCYACNDDKIKWGLVDSSGNYHFIPIKLGYLEPHIIFQKCMILHQKKVIAKGWIRLRGSESSEFSGMKLLYATERNKTLIVQKTVAVVNAQGRFKVKIPYSPDGWLILVQDSARATCYKLN